jgi:hypothetical protein
MSGAQRSEAPRSPGRFDLVPTFQWQTAPYELRCEAPWYAPPAGAAAVFAGAKSSLAPATKIEGGGWG